MKLVWHLLHRWLDVGEHSWVYANGVARTCSMCGRHERLMTKRYPLPDEPATQWRRWPL